MKDKDENAPAMPEHLNYLSDNVAIMCVVGLRQEQANGNTEFNCSHFLGMHRQAMETCYLASKGDREAIETIKKTQELYTMQNAGDKPN